MVGERTQEAIQQMVDDAPKAKWYFSDGFDAYSRLWYHSGRYEVSEGKNDTYSVEGDNAELRHYLARLARKSRCFSRCLEVVCVFVQSQAASQADLPKLPSPYQRLPLPLI